MGKDKFGQWELEILISDKMEQEMQNLKTVMVDEFYYK